VTFFITSSLRRVSLQAQPGRILEDVRTAYAVTRCLEIISEASRRLPDELKARHPEIPWKQIAGAGNVYRHDYEDVAARYVWDTVQRDPPALKAVMAGEIDRLSQPGSPG
jgi:uncharacterized protein with HEPN domain